jgi:hypothetical protein
MAVYKCQDFGPYKTEIGLPPLARGQATFHPHLAEGQAKLCRVPEFKNLHKERKT